VGNDESFGCMLMVENYVASMGGFLWLYIFFIQLFEVCLVWAFVLIVTCNVGNEFQFFSYVGSNRSASISGW